MSSVTIKTPTPGANWSNPIWYRDYRIYFSSSPIANYAFVHDDYDGAPDANDNRGGWGNSIEDCKAQIDDMEE